MPRIPCLVLLLLLGVAALPAFPEERYIIQGRARHSSLEWWTEVLLHNAGNMPAEVRLLRVSNGTLVTRPTFRDRFIIPPETTTTLFDNIGSDWDVVPMPTHFHMWVTTVDAPSNVIIDTSLLGTVQGAGPPNLDAVLGRLSLPVFKELTPANERKIHLGTDLATYPSRTNVGIYNASPVTANAVIETRRSCDDAVLSTREVVVPANTILQVLVHISERGDPGCADGRGSRWNARYVVVKVDQPSLSYVAALRNDAAPVAGATIPTKP